MKSFSILIAAVAFTACYGTSHLNGDSVECASDCDDSDPCTSDICDSEGECQHFPIPFCEGCASHLECDDGDDCTMDVCAFDGECVHDLVCIEGLDIDGDGFDYPVDCDDHRPDVYPGAEEVCDLIRDNDCDGEVDEDGCEYNCPVDSDFCIPAGSVSTDQVAIDLYRGCTLEPQPPVYYEAADRYGWTVGVNVYQLFFSTINLEPGDVIEHLIIRSWDGTPITEPTFVGAVADLYLAFREPSGDGSIERYFKLTSEPQLNDGQFIFDNYGDGITIPDLENIVRFEVWIHIPHSGRGYIQFGLLELSDFQVAGKTTISRRCEPEPQLGQFGMIVCLDRDCDGHDAIECGGDDSDDLDPTII